MKRKITALALAALFALAATAALAACSSGSGGVGPDSIKEVTTTQQTSGTTHVTNYQAVVADSAGWDSLSDADRQKVIGYAFSESLQQIEEDNVNTYNILGVSEEGQVLFMFDRNAGEVIVYQGGQPTARVPAPQQEA